MITADNLIISRGGRVVVDHVDFTTEGSTMIGVVGPNGAGKSSLLAALYGVLKRDSGKIVVDERELRELSHKEIARRMAVVSQRPRDPLALTVRDSVQLGRLAHRSMLSYGNAEDKVLTQQALEMVELDHLADRLTSELSGGEQQRVMIARAIVQQADHMLLDEPTNHLDIHHSYALMDLVTQLECVSVVVLHDLNLAARYCDSIVLLDQGAVVASGPAFDVLSPEIISSIYKVDVERIVHEDNFHLVYSPKKGTE
ncbi:ABC transporter ATP-binding protein [Stomatohabitans albus]|uniref:ABC transporter ATP-binding protein n=1 Tax=Stomatohabitans albus TaxID=3110766 RepID=UPI00300DB891